jgi:hypothetical protein
MNGRQKERENDDVAQISGQKSMVLNFFFFTDVEAN